ncbi:MAG: hypothetical protein ABI992_01055 [Chthoniobacterales bacterium]
MSAPSSITFAEVRAAFANRKILASSDTELQQFLVALSAEPITEPTTRAQAAEMAATMRQVLRQRQVEALRPRKSVASAFALLFSLAALLCSGFVAYRVWFVPRVAPDALRLTTANAPSQIEGDPRTHLTVAELAHWAPTLRDGNPQAWWAGEQARQIQKLESQAKRQALAGDFDGAARSADRADALRSGVGALADFEKPPVP